ncbi:MAG: alkaline phosphatase, partial [Acidobacteria bacterium]|nr:alkaline phosphatase [Acidobacteriota bacterium]
LHAASVHAYGDPAKLFIQHMPYLALSDTSSASNWVSDSAAGMTAIVTGQKTHNGVLSQSVSAVPGKQDGALLKTILEYAEEHGLSTGVVSNSPMADATPAACYSHVNSRGQWGKIFAQVLKPRFGDGVDVIIGPGRTKMLEDTQALGIDMLAELPKAGFYVSNKLEGIPAGTKRAVILHDNANHDLAAATKAAIEILSRNPKGFFLMVESDVHTNRLPLGLDRVATFDKIIQDTAQRMSKKTLVLFTADHSFDLRVSGGAPKGQPLVTISKESGKGVASKGLSVIGHHSGEQVLVAAQGPGAKRVRGFITNTDLFGIMLDAFGWSASKPGM